MTVREDAEFSCPYVKQTNRTYNQFNTIDEEYEKSRNKLLPVAVAKANLAAGPRPSVQYNGKEAKEAWGTVWNDAFHATMKDLCNEAGI